MENAHIVSRYDKNLDRIKSGIMDMGGLVISQLCGATEALIRFDADTVEKLIATDRKINGMQQDIYAQAERLIALRQPMAIDLRQALSPINIASELERIGDHAKTTAKRARVFANLVPDAGLLSVVEDMSGQVQNMLSDALHAYETSDTDLAAAVRSRDVEIDQMNKDVLTMAVALMDDADGSAEPFVHFILLARGFERVGDHVVNITRHIHQIVTGEDLKASE